MADAETGVRDQSANFGVNVKPAESLAVTCQSGMSPSPGPCEKVRVGGKPDCPTK